MSEDLATRLPPPPPLPVPLPRPIVIRRLQAKDRPALAHLVSEDALFTREEVSVALELIDAALARPDHDYSVLVAEREGRAATPSIDGYVCFGPTPMTDGTWDLYWIVTHPEARGRGVARALVEKMESELRQRGARRVRVETSHLDGYGAARAFYERMRYPVVARVTDFYRAGDDLLIMMKRL